MVDATQHIDAGVFGCYALQHNRHHMLPAARDLAQFHPHHRPSEDPITQY